MDEVKTRPTGAIALGVGILLILVAVLADTLGVGGQSGFGWKQAVLLGLGVIASIVGLAILTGVAGRAVRESVEDPKSGGRQDPPMPPPD